MTLLDAPVTTTRSRTQLLPNTVALFTDLYGFNKFHRRFGTPAIEDLLDYWDEAHEAAAADHGGTIRVIMVDSYFLTFKSPSACVAAWLDLRARAAAFPDPNVDGIHFSAGADHGDLYLFKNSVFGEPATRAAKNEHRAHALRRDCLVIPLSMAESLDESLTPHLFISPLSDGLVTVQLGAPRR